MSHVALARLERGDPHKTLFIVGAGGEVISRVQVPPSTCHHDILKWILIEAFCITFAQEMRLSQSVAKR